MKAEDATQLGQRFRLTDDELDNHIYRIIGVDRLLELVRTGRLTIVHPRKWDDPFENLLDAAWIGNRYPIMGDGLEAAEDIRELDEKIAKIRRPVFGQCWTWNVETDAMWRIYSPDKRGVKITTTPRLLIDALKRSDAPAEGQHCFIGKVQYDCLRKIQSAFAGISERLNPDSPCWAVIAELRLWKREAFVHEKEVRLLYVGPSEDRDSYSFAIDLNAMVKRIVFDPRMSDDLYRVFERVLPDLGYGNEIQKSELYRPPESWSLDI
ncbi:MAG: DUF2971 domain-containing protein [Porticoccaceae bacterium]